MIYLARGELPEKHHISAYGPDGKIRWEECFTREGFEAPYTILYHQRRPHEARVVPAEHGWKAPVAADPQALSRRHFKTQDLAGGGGAPIDAVVPLLTSRDVTVGLAAPDREDPVYHCNADGDELYWIHEGSGTLRTTVGDLRFTKDDYVFVPKAMIHRFIPDPGPQRWLYFELPGGMWLPKQWRNETGQLRMDAPYCHRDFVAPTFVGPQDEGIRDQVVKRGGRWHGMRWPESPLDVVGWDGSIWPFVFPILKFQPRAGLVHLPPSWHGTFATRGGLICSFVPRIVDFHDRAIPCPYPHSSVDVDEMLFYARGNFVSRRGVGPGSMSFHPAGIPHGPHPGAYEGSIGHKRTDELAVMLDVIDPLLVTTAALGIEDPGYHDSFISSDGR